MTKLLYIEASPRENSSISAKISEAFLAEYRKSRPHDTILKLNVWEAGLPEFNEEFILAKYNILHAQPHTPIEEKKWQEIKKIFTYFASFDKYLIAIPMWNFSIPYKLKQYIDILTQPTLAFNYHPEKGFTGLLEKKKALLIYTRGGDYQDPSRHPLDFQKTYMQLWLSFLGIHDIEEIICEPTLLGKTEVIQKTIDEAIHQSIKIAGNF